MYGAKDVSRSQYHSPARASPGVRFFYHYPKDFLRPYGYATERKKLTDDKFIGDKLRPFSCEWLVRPGIALSEFADTVSKNHETCIADTSLLLHPTLKGQFDAFLREMLPLISSFCNTTVDSQEVPLDYDTVLKRMKRLRTKFRKKQVDDTFMSYIEHMIRNGASLFLLGLHMRVASYVFNNLDACKKVCSADANLGQFKNDGTIESFSMAAYKDYERKCGFGNVETTTAVRRSLQEILSSLPPTDTVGTSSHHSEAHTAATHSPLHALPPQEGNGHPHASDDEGVDAHESTSAEDHVQLTSKKRKTSALTKKNKRMKKQ